MLNQAIKNTIQTTYNELETAGFKKRKPQMLLLGKLATASANEQVFIAEASTGVGKTAAYSIALIPIAIEKKQPLVISTATIALQNQLVDDLTTLKKHTSLDFTFEQAKGRTNFFCLASADRFIESGNGSEAERFYVENLLSCYDSKKWLGDFDMLEGAVIPSLHKTCSSSPDSCNRKLCPYEANCPYYNKIDSVRDADVVIANHALVTSIANIGFSAYLKPDDDTCKPLLVLDEAHHIHDAFRDSMQVCVNFMELNKKIKGATSFDKELKPYNDIARVCQAISSISAELITNLSHINGDALAMLSTESTCRFNPSTLDGALVSRFYEMKQLVDSLASQTTKVQSFVTRNKNELPTATLANIETKLSMINTITSKLTELFEELSSDSPKAAWFGQSAIGASVNACPLDVAELFQSKIVDNCTSISLVSATLRTDGSFGRIIERLGLPSETQQLLVPSPYNPSNATLHLPNSGYSPNDHRHVLQIANDIPDLIKEHEGSMVLFSSWLKLNAFKSALPKHIRDICLVQGDLSRIEVLRIHKQRIDQGLKSVILGLASFGEGVDLSGKYLTTIIITQIPFRYVNDPIGAAESEHIIALGQNPFAKVQLPDAQLKIIQWCGRLLRSENDKGDIYIYDNRISSKQYGQGILNALPNYKRA